MTHKNAATPAGGRGSRGVPKAFPGGKETPPTPHRNSIASPAPREASLSWRLIGSDATGRRVAAVCSGCGQARQFGADAFRGGYVAPCDCVRLAASRATRVRSFASTIAAAERQGAPVRHRGGA